MAVVVFAFQVLISGNFVLFAMQLYSILSDPFPVNSLYFFKANDARWRHYRSASVHGGVAMGSAMRILAPLLHAAVLALISIVPVRADGSAGTCLSDAELRDLVNSGQIVPQIYAFRTARNQTGGDVVRASLCPKDAGLVYMITTLSKDGKLSRIDISAVTGKPLVP